MVVVVVVLLKFGAWTVPIYWYDGRIYFFLNVCEREFGEKRKISKITWSPARAERETAFALDFPESLPALPPAYKCKKNKIFKQTIFPNIIYYCFIYFELISSCYFIQIAVN